MSFLNLAFLVGGKYFIKNFSAKSFQVVIESDGKEFNQALARSLKEYGNNLSFKISSVTPFILNALATYMNNRRWRWGSSIGNPLNWPTVCNIWNMTSLSSKWRASISSYTMLEFNPSKFSWAKPFNALSRSSKILSCSLSPLSHSIFSLSWSLSPPPWLAISITWRKPNCSLLLRQKVRSILGSNGTSPFSYLFIQ